MFKYFTRQGLCPLRSGGLMRSCNVEKTIAIRNVVQTTHKRWKWKTEKAKKSYKNLLKRKEDAISEGLPVDEYKIYVEVILDDGVLSCLRKFMVDDFETHVKEVVVWTISNLLTGTEEQIRCVIEDDVIGPIVDLFQHAEFDIQEGPVWEIINACFYGTLEQIEYLVSQGCIKPICDLLPFVSSFQYFEIHSLHFLGKCIVIGDCLILLF